MKADKKTTIYLAGQGLRGDS